MIKTSGKQTARPSPPRRSKFDPKVYATLLVEHLPAVIASEKENDAAMETACRLMKKGPKGRSPEETRLLNLLGTLIESFEQKAYPIGHSEPSTVLRELMREHELKQSDLLDIFGSQGTVSQVLSGRRAISKTQARKLSERFRLPIDLFI
jgi:HTH-type transcriptional regulator/antitoxin HigA